MNNPHRKTKSSYYACQRGFVAHIVPLAVVIIGAIAIVGVAVGDHSSTRQTNQSINLTSSEAARNETATVRTPTASSLSVQKTTSNVSAVQPTLSGAVVHQPATISTSPTTNSLKATASAPTATSVTNQTVSPPMAPVTQTTETPLSVLTSLISGLDNGINVNVTASPVTIPGPISDATGQPIVFTANGQTYYAYTQEQAPDFSTSAAVTADSMAIVTAPSNSVALTDAYIDKSGELTDPNFQLVGFSTGGD